MFATLLNESYGKGLNEEKGQKRSTDWPENTHIEIKQENV